MSIDTSTLIKTTDGNEVEYGAWINKSPACKVCNFTNPDKVHELAFKGTSYKEIVRTLSEGYSYSLSDASITRHFKNHFILKPNQNQLVTGSRKVSSDFGSSINELVTNIHAGKATFFDSVSKVLQSKLSDLKKLEDVRDLVEEELYEEITDEEEGVTFTGFTGTDKHSEALYKRWTNVAKQISNSKNDIIKTFENAQVIISKQDQDVIKNYIFLTKSFILQSLVDSLGKVLFSAHQSGTIDEELRSILAKELMSSIKDLEGDLNIDLLYQESIEKMKENELRNK